MARVLILCALFVLMLVVANVRGPGFLDTSEAAVYLGVSRKTMERWRWAGGGPDYFKVGAYVRYTVADLDRWLASRRRRSTSDPGPDLRNP